MRTLFEIIAWVIVAGIPLIVVFGILPVTIIMFILGGFKEEGK